jgi:hypothetical protein
MKRFQFSKLLLLILLFISNIACSQGNFVTLDTANGRTFQHGAIDIKVIDKRMIISDTLGIIRTGKLNGKQPLKTKGPFTLSIENYYKTLSSTSKIQTDKKLVVLIYKFEANEGATGFTDETASFIFTADYFISNEYDQYQLLGMIDTVINVKAVDVTNKLLRTIDESLCTLYEYTYTLTPKDKKRYFYEETLIYDEIEKNNQPAFQKEHFENGLFETWIDFLKLNITDTSTIYKKGKKFAKSYLNQDGKQRIGKLPNNIRVLCYKDKAYYKLGNIYYPLFLKNNNFHFIGRLSHDKYDPIAVGIMFGLTGVLLLNVSEGPLGYDGTELTGTLYEFMVESRTGKTFPIEKVYRNPYRSKKTIKKE